jgi:N-acetylmuramoyl-L-alanine amidase
MRPERWGWAVAPPVLCLVLGAAIAAARVSVTPEGSRSIAPQPAPGSVSASASAWDTGTGASLVILDPGHGGSNAGAPSRVSGVYEKHLTLALAVELASRLRARGFRVLLTRQRDEYHSLRQRIAFANRAGGDLFISLHGNASESHSQRGFETYLLTPRALDIDARALRLAEGRARPGLPLEHRTFGALDTALLLDDIERGLSQPAAAALAGAIQRELAARRGPDGDRGVRQAPMDVLYGAAMPAVLVEVGFLDHPVEGRELFDPSVRSAIADAIADAVAGQHPTS